MKRFITTTAAILITLSVFSQNEKMFDKYNVESYTLNGIPVLVGDTLTFNSGTGLNGTFVCTQLDPTTMVKSGLIPSKLTANYSGMSFIISKVRVMSEGMNTQAIAIIYISNKVPAWVDLSLGIRTGEIIIK